MKSLIVFFSLLLSSLFVSAQESEETKGITITVVVENIKNNNGNVLFGLHTSETFMQGPGIQNASGKIEDGKVKITFTNVPEGTYAIMVLHDENENNRMDFDASGMPKESYGMSNNDMSFGPPEFGNAKFEVKDKDLELNIRI
ncbi:DUF2141 domain-containing protein [Leptobacterium flavescens]|uniref:DUF2141 domain-containing protein n=1 Tax=Leptobacterium flavescens TaxID=472055 RepID=A0A6P0UQK0_9FLAO|nr:DUF2141 domain-containing protein [Leptobacterium flavescens]NER14099.1 DUF2141 domain-containing protein [Leptobacterium flavescens]